MSTTTRSTSIPPDRLLTHINGALDAYTQFGEACPAQLAAAMRYGLLGPGKRLRPRLAILASAACGGSLEAALPAACAVEMIHAYSLIHDDLPAMDDDDLRRGRPTCHKVFGEATAILAGDSLLTLAFEVLARDVQPAELAARCCCELAHAAGATELVGGQADDLAAQAGAWHAEDNNEKRGEVSSEWRTESVGDGRAASLHPNIETLQAIHRRKTGAIFRAALRLGGLIGGATDEELGALDRFGSRFGLAFQITDDLLDVSGDQQTVGKRVGKDARLGKMTFPGLMGVAESRRRAEELVEEACEAAARFGKAGRPLAELAQFILARNR